MTDKCVWLKRPVILFGKFCLSITPQWLNTEIPDIVWQVLHSCVVSILGTILRSSLQGDGCVEDHDAGVWIKMCITCEPITYIMLNGSVSITGHCITYTMFYIYINKTDTMTDLKGSERPRITVIYSNFLGYGSLFGQGSIPTYYHFSPLSPQITDIIYTINKY